jgi:hypothetical protein
MRLNLLVAAAHPGHLVEQQRVGLLVASAAVHLEEDLHLVVLAR